MPDIQLRVIKAWRATYDPALKVTPGEVIALGRQDDAYPGWQWVVNKSGLGGWVPIEILDGVRVAADFDTAELTVSEGEAVTGLSERVGWIWCQKLTREAGWVPAAHLAQIR
ncbi:hypothetical protein GTA62_03705 [Roseobacter sp. HKCCD9010]|uniref:SH3 domain-containing protein n=1 Tax=unclassified Roseobacter TaxID=196798 RepID=UPI0014917C46|nr:MULTISPECIES: SH3 domain-containing protein [unclassified Roseobacter]MBF9049027.1 hypothetical protein [Rhodobacterales bacterium HKCCD4356]NNV11027.1 hypothetical protein [Roseobacter sp. HKCCD7357]NNV15211.1 hypothetical protein [Roseobacter sp. HKCCD8768]NNV24671.1 hypothetical protein [Roseobacter sp. HKCCD8192]NNV28927.1 hypothetical protein [Roseobacter sp. HKCCD9061]